MRTATTRLGIPALGLLFVCSLALGDETPRLEVPFTDLQTHRSREDRFLAAVDSDPVLSRVPLVYILGPEAP